MPVLQSQGETTTGTLSLDLPVGAGVGGYAIFELTADGASDTFTPVQEGWTQAFINTAAHDHRSAWYVREITEAPPSSWSFTGPSDFGGRLVVVMPASGRDILAVDYEPTDNGSGAVSATTPIANVADERVWIGFWTNDSAFTVATPPSGATQVGSVHGSGGSSTASACYYIENPADVGTITRSLTWSGSDSIVAFAILVSFTEGGGGTEYEGAIAEAAEAGESVSAQLDTTGAITEAAEAGESTNGRLDMHASITAGAEAGMSFDTDLSFDTEDEGAESGATFGATVTIPLSFTAGAVAGDEFEGVGDENKSIEDGAASGDTFGALMAALGSTTDGAESGDDYASILAGSGGWDAGAESGDGWEAHLTSYADWSAGASAGMALSTVAPPVETPLVVITRALRFTRFILRILRF